MNQNAPSSGGVESIYGGWKREADRLSDLKTEYHLLLRKPEFFKADNRTFAINLAKILVEEVSDVMDEEEFSRIQSVIGKMSTIDDQIKTLMMSTSGMDQLSYQIVINNNSASFANIAHYFIREFNVILQNHNLGIKTKKKQDEFKRLYKIFSVDNKFNNLGGVPISAEMETLARICKCRMEAQWDNFFVIEGETGVGKSMFAYAFGTSIAEKVGIPFDVENNIIFNESKEYVTRRIKTAAHGDVIILDEGGNQANTKTWWEKDQVEFMNLINLVRFHNLTVLINWTDIKSLDKTMRERVHGVISIKRRGTAILRTFNKNPYVADRIYLPQSAKSRVAYTSDEAQGLMEAYDQMISLKIPFYEVPSKIWELYKIRKEKALSLASLSKKVGSTHLLADDYYLMFLLQHPQDKFEITTNELYEYAKKNSFALSMKTLAKSVAKATNRKVEEVFVNTNPADLFDGYIRKDAYILGYIEKLRAQKAGSEQTKEDLGSESIGEGQ